MDLYIPQVPHAFNWGFALVVVAAATWRGGRDEWIAALVVVFQTVNGHVPILHWSNGAPTDLGSLAILSWLVIRGARYWTIWAAASSLLSVMTHVFYAAVPGMSLWAYMSAQQAFAYVLMGAVLIGALQSKRPRC